MINLFSKCQPNEYVGELLEYNYPSSNKSENIPSSLQYRKFINWMSFLKPDSALNQISLPGTSQSAIYNLKSSLLFEQMIDTTHEIERSLSNENYQRYNIMGQLMMGVRFFSFICVYESNNKGFFSLNGRDSFTITMEEGLKNQMHVFFEKFNKISSELALLHFDFCGVGFEKEQALKKMIINYLELEKYGIRNKKFDPKITLSELRSKNIRYIVFLNSKGLNNNDDFFIDSKTTLQIKQLSNIIKVKKTNNEFDENIKGDYLIWQELSNNYADFTPAFFEKFYKKTIDLFLDEIIEEFHPEQKISNIFTRQFIDLSPNFLKNVIFLNHLKGNMIINEYITLLFRSSDHYFEEYMLKTCFKFTKMGEISLGLPNMPECIRLFHKKIVHKMFFESLLTTCFTKREENLIIECPKGYIVSYVRILNEWEDITNKLKFIIIDGWVMEPKLHVIIKSLRNFLFEIYVEAIPFTPQVLLYYE